MNTPEIEYLIAQAISKRPSVTSAPMNLYIYEQKLICGARTVMPKDADFVAYVPPYQLEKGFNEKEWKLIVERIGEIVGPGDLTDVTGKRPAAKESRRETQAAHVRVQERRRERRLRCHRPMLYAQNLDEAAFEGRIRDISSGGMAFTCQAADNCPDPGRQIATRFSVPRLNPDGSFDTVSFERRGRTCRVENVNDHLRRVAIQFAKPLPFKPGEQAHAESRTGHALAWPTI